MVTGSPAQNLGVLAGGSSSTASAASADGSTVIGVSGSSAGERAFRWTASGGMQSLGVLAGGGTSSAKGVSDDGTVVVGVSDSEAGGRAFRWTVSGGMQDLGVLPGGESSAANGVSGDGRVIVGQSGSRDSSGAFVWSHDRGGMMSLQEHLAEIGADLSGWSALLSATGISADGRFVVGSGMFEGATHAFVADLQVPEPPACPGELDGNGAVDAGDIAALLVQFGQAGGPADLDGSGTVDAGDVSALLTLFGPCQD
jgi:probable HAF family extracellular repeat protein